MPLEKFMKKFIFIVSLISLQSIANSKEVNGDNVDPTICENSDKTITMYSYVRMISLVEESVNSDIKQNGKYIAQVDTIGKLRSTTDFDKNTVVDEFSTSDEQGNIIVLITEKSYLVDTNQIPKKGDPVKLRAKVTIPSARLKNIELQCHTRLVRD